jgi:hypothetical protein
MDWEDLKRRLRESKMMAPEEYEDEDWEEDWDEGEEDWEDWEEEEW